MEFDVRVGQTIEVHGLQALQRKTRNTKVCDPKVGLMLGQLIQELLHPACCSLQPPEGGSFVPPSWILISSDVGHNDIKLGWVTLL